MNKFLLLAPCVALTFACSGGTTNNSVGNSGTTGAAMTGNAAGGGNSAGTAGSATGSAAGTATAEMTMQPGQWEFAARVTDFEMPGAPPEQLEKMRTAMAGAQAQTQRQCLTQADVSNIAEKIAQQGSQGGQCTFERQTFGGGNIDVAGTCQGPQGRMQMEITGSYTGTTSQMNLTINVAGQQNMQLSTSVAGRRVGECPA